MLQDHVIHVRNGLLADTTPDDVHRIVSRATATDPPGRLVIHFHGGLVSRPAGMRIAERLKLEYEAAGAYPLFVVWESGLLDIIAKNLDELARERLFRLLWKRVGNLARRKFRQDAGGRSAQMLPQLDPTADDDAIDMALDAHDVAALEGREPEPPGEMDELTEFERLTLENELSRDVELMMEIEAVSNGLRTPADIDRDMATRGSPYTRASAATLMDPHTVERLVERPAPGARGVISTARFVKAVVVVSARVISRFVRKRDHGFHATVVEEILREFYFATVGGIIWSTMKKDTWDAFGGDPDRHGGTALLHALRDATPGTAGPQVCLIGHSTGAIYISAFLEHAHELLPADTRFDVLFLAPASTFEVVATTLRDHRDRIGAFRMFTMTDDNERLDRLVPVLYPHSLLYFVSGVVEDEADMPIVGMQRYFDPNRYEATDFPSVEAVRRFVNGNPRHTVWSIASGGDGLSSSAASHTAFDEERVTVDSIKHILTNGF